MNYREKQKKDPAEKKLRKLSVYRKKYKDPAVDQLAGILTWEENADREIAVLQDAAAFIPRAGEELYMTGYAGAAGTMFLADWKKETLSRRFPTAFINTVKDRDVFGNFFDEDPDEIMRMPRVYIEEGASWIAPIGEAGLLKTLYRFGKETGLGFRVEARQVPVRQVTIEFCEFFLLHPWELLTGRSFLFTAEHNSPLLRRLEKEGISFRKIGLVTEEKQKLICHGEEESNINRPEPDGLLTLLLEDKKA